MTSDLVWFKSAPMIFDTKVAILILNDLPVWQKLNVAAFLATGIAGAAPEAMGEPYVNGAGRKYGNMLGQPMLIFGGEFDDLRRADRIASERGLLCVAYVRAMFSTGHDAANREAFAAEPIEAPDLVGVALRGPKKDVDKAIKGARLHG